MRHGEDLRSFIPPMTFRTPREERYFEDYLPGAVHEFGSIMIEEAEIIEFAQRFDPQPFHTDPEAAKQSAFGGLIASGWHTASLAMRLLVDHYVARGKSGFARSRRTALAQASTSRRQSFDPHNCSGV